MTYMELPPKNEITLCAIATVVALIIVYGS